jgi:hypothetical protein
MSILDSDTLKNGITLLTDLLNAINNITDALGGKSSGALKIGAALGLGVLTKKGIGAASTLYAARAEYGAALKYYNLH